MEFANLSVHCSFRDASLDGGISLLITHPKIKKQLTLVQINSCSMVLTQNLVGEKQGRSVNDRNTSFDSTASSESRHSHNAILVTCPAFPTAKYKTLDSRVAP